MRRIENVKAISSLFLILLLLISAIIGALLSYLWVVGYYVSLDRVYPEDITVNITDYAFDPQNASYFNVTIQCPTSYKSKEPANITRITVSTEDGVLHDEIATDPPSLPHKFQRKGESQTFKCLWNWANYTGETIKIIAFVADGSGPTFEAETPLVNLKIIDPRFDSTISVTHFNMTVELDSPIQDMYVNITGVSIEEKSIPAENLTLYPIPYPLNPDRSVSFTCAWNWTNYQDQNVTLAVHTLQGYTAYHIHATPKPVFLTITNVLFNVTDATYFNVTIQNSKDSPTYVNITSITVTIENETFPDIPIVPPPEIPYGLNPGANVTFKCSWNWTDYREKNVTITVRTLQDFTKFTTQATTPRVILTITDALFNITDTSHFNVTIRNSEFSLEEFVNITRITVENGARENLTIVPPPSLNYTLYVNKSVTFKCNWDWTSHWNDDVTITVYSLQGYSASYTKVTPAPLVISDALFNATDTSYFNITVKNHELSPSYVLVTSITVTLENGTIQDVTVVAPRLPYMLHQNESVIFNCSWDWTDYRGKNVTITVYTLEGYEASYTRTTP